MGFKFASAQTRYIHVAYPTHLGGGAVQDVDGALVGPLEYAYYNLVFPHPSVTLTRLRLRVASTSGTQNVDIFLEKISMVTGSKTIITSTSISGITTSWTVVTWDFTDQAINNTFDEVYFVRAGGRSTNTADIKVSACAVEYTVTQL